jgi:hypothetical protein
MELFIFLLLIAGCVTANAQTQKFHEDVRERVETPLPLQRAAILELSEAMQIESGRLALKMNEQFNVLIEKYGKR